MFPKIAGPGPAGLRRATRAASAGTRPGPGAVAAPVCRRLDRVMPSDTGGQPDGTGLVGAGTG